MLGRHRINTSVPFRSSLSNAAFAVEERVVWGGVDLLRGVADVVRWPFERAVWAVERELVWPLEERTGHWSGPIRAAGVAALAVFAVGAGVLGLVWASGSGGGAAAARQASAPVAAPVVTQAPEEKLAQAAPALQGAAPNFTPAGGAVSKTSGETATKAGGEESAASATATADTPSTASPSTGSSTTAAVAGPAATKVAHRFAGAFVLYETGRDDAKVRAAFAATATPELARSLLQRPPRLPANVKVPRAKVLNIVPGPHQGDTYTLSVSLLRVGVTSELRLDMQRDQKTDEWQVADVRG